MATTEKTFKAQSQKHRALFIPKRVIKISSIVALVAIAVVAFLWFTRKTPLERGMIALVNAFSQRRLIEPRLSGGFKAGQFNPANSDATGIDQEELARARKLIEDAVVTGDAHASLAYGRLLLCQNDKGKMLEALKYLRLAAASLPESPEAHNDLGVYFFQRGKIEDAFDEFNLALRYNPRMPEAQFNRALSLQRLALREAARASFTTIAQTERDEGWLKEARQRLDEVSTPVQPGRNEAEVTANLTKALEGGDVDAVRNSVLQNYVAAWKLALNLVGEQLEAALAGDAEKAERALSHIETIGNVASELNKDSSLAYLAKYLRALPDREKQTELQLFKAHKEAVAKLDAARHVEAQPLLERLRQLYKERGNELFQIRCAHEIAQCQHLSNNFTACIETLKEALPLIEQRGFIFNHSRAFGLLGQSYSRLGQDSTAIKYYRQSIELFRKTHESVAKLLQLMGMAYWHLGNLDTALDNLRQSTNLYLTGDASLPDLAYNYINIADIHRLGDRRHLALLYAEQTLLIADQSQDNNRAAQASSLSAVEHAQAGHLDEAEEDLRRAFEYLNKANADQRAYTEPLVLTRAGKVASLHDDTARAIEYYSKAVSLAGSGEGKTILQMNALRERAEARLKAGQNQEAQTDLQQAISLIESYRENLTDRSHRVEFLAASQSAFDQMIILSAADPGGAVSAFNLSERSRARSLLDEITMRSDSAESRIKTTAGKSASPRDTASTLDLAKVQAELPADVTLLDYCVTNQQTYIFIVTRNAFEMVPSSINSAQVARLVGDYVSDITNKISLSEVSDEARELYHLLIEPIEGRIARNTKLCIVPDKALHFLPFAALKDASDHYLIESFRLTYAPSASVFIRCLNEDRAKAIVGPERLLAVGNPEFDKEEFPELHNLTDAQREAEESSRSYVNPTVLVGPEATEPAVREAMRQCNVAHLALHCLVEEQSPWMAALVLASPAASQKPHRPISDDERLESGDSTRGTGAAIEMGNVQAVPDDPNDGLLYLSEVYNLNLPHTRLVILSACNSALGHYYGGEGMVSLIHPLIAARVSTVVASLWFVESQATSDLMIEFHKRRKAGSERAADALRAAQLWMLENGRAHPYYWASFIVVGGDY